VWEALGGIHILRTLTFGASLSYYNNCNSIKLSTIPKISGEVSNNYLVYALKLLSIHSERESIPNPSRQFHAEGAVHGIKYGKVNSLQIHFTYIQPTLRILYLLFPTLILPCLPPLFLTARNTIYRFHLLKPLFLTARNTIYRFHLLKWNWLSQDVIPKRPLGLIGFKVHT